MGNGATVAAGGQKAASRPKRKSEGGIGLFRWLTRNAVWDTFILLCIVANAAILGYDAHFGEANPYHSQIELWNNYFLYIFTAELVLEFLAQGPDKYLRSGWNWFDVLVVGVCYVATNPAISALRTLRVVRVFRLISAVPQMRRVVEALFSALPGIMATFAILAIVFYIGAVMATTLFHNEARFPRSGRERAEAVRAHAVRRLGRHHLAIAAALSVGVGLHHGLHDHRCVRGAEPVRGRYRRCGANRAARRVEAGHRRRRR